MIQTFYKNTTKQNKSKQWWGRPVGPHYFNISLVYIFIENFYQRNKLMKMAHFVVVVQR